MLFIASDKASSKVISPFFHTRKGGRMRASVTARIRKDRRNQDNTASVYLQVIINSDRTTIPLKISWPVEFFDNKSGMFLPRTRSDREAQDFNMLLTKEKSKVNEIFMFYRHSDFELSVEQFHKEYSRYGVKKNFLMWADLDNEDRYAAGMISTQTYKNTKSQLKKISLWKTEIRFGDLGKQFFENLEAWLRSKQGLKINSAWSILKMVKATANRAAQQGIAIDTQSIGQYSLPRTTSKFIFLNEKELSKLKFHYYSQSIKPTHKRVLGQFLFACCTGLRFSDIQRITWKEILDDTLIFEPYKTRNIEKQVKIPLIFEAFEFIENRRGPLFNCLKEQPTNRILKDIALEKGIRKNLTTHVARHTFATSFLRHGGHIEVLQRLLGHSKISTTMIYTHVDEDRLREQMELLSKKGK